ncbi:hypothetical protein COCCADRAFT_103674 [Bipolaris zeicola 26-R-13]|uniref:Uncharacterized protein n=1 Tax=Cochliobolus carbonum (strain 26-R-13) TaxID=930089 RepID=W6YGU2_COCC2|nr:uncharacterized protein COCCADRAFT_103674 [Bipolaris zeicola 26-R-13]EUC30541.1 hypothetical protein COCCADRAFT_103674 [Bipolaris zeicola 26-R-13]
MHDAAPASYDPPSTPPRVDASDHHDNDDPHEPPIHLFLDEPLHHDEPPPSYDDAIATSGAPPDYGTFSHFLEESSIASSDMDPTDRALPEWLGQLLVVFVFLCLIYGFWRFVHSDDMPDGEWPHFGPPST